MSTGFFDSLGEIRALEVGDAGAPRAARTIAEARGYRKEDLLAIAEVAYHYLFSGGEEIARTLYEGLCAVDPAEAYFALALGLTHDRLNDKNGAETWYRRAGELDPRDGRPDVNRAELRIEDGDHRRARLLLVTGADKARRRGDDALLRKATALIAHLDSQPAARAQEAR